MNTLLSLFTGLINNNAFLIWLIIVLSIYVFYIIPKNKKYINKIKSNQSISNAELETMMDYFDYVPNLCITLGIFGTFFGLVYGLGSITNKNSTEELQKNIQILIGSISTAFVTSLIGIVASYFSKLYYSKYSKIISERFNSKNEDDQKSILQTLIDIKTEIISINKNPFSKLSEKLDREIKSFIQNLYQSSSNVIQDFVIKFDHLNNILENSNKSISSSFEVLKDYKTFLDGETATLKSHINEFSKISDGLIEANNQLIKNIESNRENILSFSSTINETKENLFKIRELSEKLFNYIDNSSNYLSSFNDKMNSLFESSNKNINQFAENTTFMFNNIEQRLNTFLEFNENKFQNLFNNSQQIIEILSNFSNKLKEEFLNSFNEFQNILQNNIYSINNNLEQILNSTDGIISNLPSQLNKNLTESFFSLDKHMQLILENFKIIADSIDQKIESFKEFINLYNKVINSDEDENYDDNSSEINQPIEF